jgi:putative ABC transport system permease protein
VLLEELVIRNSATVAGLFLGLGLAKGLNALFVHFGIDLPQAGTVFATRTIVVALVVGIVVTLLAAVRPAIRATRVPPISAVREGAVLPVSRFARFGPLAALLTIGAAVALMLVGLFVGSLSTTQRLLAIGVGAAAVFLGVAMLAKTLVPPLARALGWPATRIGGAAGELARGNAMRNPQRTASTASALMIGLALVTLVSVLASGLKTTFSNAVDSVFKGDYAVTATDNFSPISIASANHLRSVPGVKIVSGVRAGDGKAYGKRIGVTGVSGDIAEVIVVKWQAGSQAVPAHLGRDGAFVSKDYAKKHHLSVGSPLAVEVPSGKTLHLVLRGIFAPPKGGSPYGDVTISTQRFDAEYQNPQNVYAFVNMTGGVTDANTTTLTKALDNFPDAKIATASQFKKNQESGIDTLLNLLYVLLSLSIIISLFGIVNTLVLTVFERTRELGMLRAIGMTRRQVRRMIRHESIVTALIGAALGIPVGVVLALMVGRAIKYPAFTIPVGTLVVFVIAAILAGLVAAILPARRAGKLNVLAALQYE